jgi:hypothetical protein
MSDPGLLVLACMIVCVLAMIRWLLLRLARRLPRPWWDDYPR